MALARYEGVAQDVAGNVIPYATVEVRQDRPGRPAVQLWGDRNGTVPLGNPIQTDAVGRFGFHAPGGIYWIRVFTGPAQQPTVQYVRRYQAIGTAAERDVEQLAAVLEAGTATFPTIEELQGFAPSADEGVGGKVTTGEGAGFYHYNPLAEEGERWVFDRPLFDTLARMNVIGGDANDIEAEIASGVADSAVVMLWIEAPNTNTGPVSINGIPVLSIESQPLIAGQFIAGRTYWFTDEGDHYRLRQETDYTGLPEGIEAVANQAIEDINSAKGDLASYVEEASEQAVIAMGAASSANSQADRAALAASAAEDAVQYTYLVDTPDDLPAGADGETAFVRSNEHVYRHNGVAWVDMGAAPSASKVSRAEIDDRVGPLELVVETTPEGVDFTIYNWGENLIDASETVVLPIGTDDAGQFPLGVLGDGTVTTKRQRVGELTLSSKAGPVITGQPSNYDFSIADEEGNVIFGVLNGQVVGAGAVNALASADLANRLAAAELQSTRIAGLQLPTADYNSIVGYGQSLVRAQEAWPALSKAQLFGNTMLGGDIRPSNSDTSTYTQFTPAGINPLVAQVISAGAILSDATVAALAAGNGAEGESPIVGMANGASQLISRRMVTPKPFLVTMPGIGGKTIEQLSKINSQDATDRYARVIAAVTAAHAAATTGSNAGKTHFVSAILWMQGQFDYDTSHGSTNATKALYKAALAQLRDDLVADIKDITGQTEDPAFIIDQVGGSYTVDADMDGLPGLHVGMAQMEFALENPTRVFIAGPTYHVTDKGGHLDPNGSRWFGEGFLAKVYNHAVVEGCRWRPLSPLRIEQETPNTLLVHFHVPKPPLVFADNYTVNTAFDYASKGFQVTDELGAIVLSGVEIVKQTIVRLTLSRELGEDAHVWYAPLAGVNGNGNLRDSDPFVTLHNYEYAGGTGQYASANIAALVDKPYPAANPCIAFHLPVGYSE